MPADVPFHEDITVRLKDTQGTVQVPSLPPVPLSYMPACLVE
jgi:hypothetical protein